MGRMEDTTPYWPAEPDGSYVLALRDGAKAYVELFASEGPRRCRVLLFLHGIGAYAAPFRGLAIGVLPAVDAVLLPDLRGHGRSDGACGVMGPPSRILDDIAELIADARRRWPGSEIVLGGESMGGLIALAYAASRREPIDRLLLLAPAVRLRIHVGSVGRALTSSKGPGRGFRMHHGPRGEVPRGPEYRASSLRDPLMLASAKAGYFATIVAWMAAWEVRYPRRVKVPTLIVQGTADRVVDPRGADVLARKLPDARLRVVQDAWHNILWDPTTPETIAAIVAWLEEPGA